MSTVPDLALNDGQTIPQLGFGVFQIEPDETAEAVQRALDIGYRHIDTAEMYRNEKGVGEAVRASGLARERGLRHQQAQQRLPPARRRPARLRRHARRARLRLRRPVPDPLAAADALRRRLRVDLADAGGVRPRRPGPLDRGLELPGRRTWSGWPPRPTSVPAVNQIEVHPYFDQDEVRAYGTRARHRDRGVVADRAGRGARRPGDRRIAERLGRTPAQVTLRWHIQRGDIVFPKSTTPARIEENFELFDFELDDTDIARSARWTRARRAHRCPPGHLQRSCRADFRHAHGGRKPAAAS